MLMEQPKGSSTWGKQAGRVTFFGIVMVVVLVIAAGILFMLISEIVKKEEVTATIQIKNDDGFPMASAAIFLDGLQVASTDSNGIYAYVYPIDKQGQSHLVRAEMTDYDPAEITLTLSGKPATFTITLQRSFATLSVIALDSLTNQPLSGVDVFLGNDKIDTTDTQGRVVMPSNLIRLQDTPVVKLEKKKYVSRLEYPYIDAREIEIAVLMAKSEKDQLPPPPPAKKSLPLAFEIIEPAQARAKVPQKLDIPQAQDTIVLANNPQFDTATTNETIPQDTVAQADAAFINMVNGQYRQALDFYRDLISQRKWQARADFWLYGADCALHMASDANAVYNEAIIDSALVFLDEAERYQNKIVEDIFPAMVHLKKGEAWSYKMELPSAKNTARLQEYRQRARFYLRSAITMMKNKGLDNTDIYRLAVEIRDDVENR